MSLLKESSYLFFAIILGSFSWPISDLESLLLNDVSTLTRLPRSWFKLSPTPKLWKVTKRWILYVDLIRDKVPIWETSKPPELSNCILYCTGWAYQKLGLKSFVLIHHLMKNLRFLYYDALILYKALKFIFPAIKIDAFDEKILKDREWSSMIILNCQGARINLL